MQTILLVEDNEMNRDLISRRLKRRGFEVIMAFDGAEGVEKANSETPDLILMDMGLPIIDGYEATRMLKEQDATRGIPIIGLSAHAMSGDADRALKAGCDDYDTKPVEWTRLLAKIQTQLERVTATTTLDSGSLASQGSDGVSGQAGARILVVDDNTMHCEILANRLNSLGHGFDIANDPKQALERLSENAYDAVLLDVTLDPMGDRTLLEHLRAHPGFKDLPVILLSPIDAMGRALQQISLGADDVVTQPFQKEILGARLDASLERHRSRKRLRKMEDEVSDARRRSRHLLSVLLPEPLVQELEVSQRLPPRRFNDVTVLMVEVAGFQKLVDQREPEATVGRLHRLMAAFEAVVQRHGMEKVRTQGSTFVAAAGLFKPRADASVAAVNCALEIKGEALRLAADWSLRLGVHCGPVVAGVIGKPRYTFDLWGEAVESTEAVMRHGALNAVNGSLALWERVEGRCSGEPLHGKTADGGTFTLYRIDQLT